ncbi:MAG TPA: hypothetical protein VMX55_03110 [candidate division Zixibacteria bacterium]|nr:hypothetical protein [candidate division Zixibacteria bacterium]
MKNCYICERSGYAQCMICRQTICKIHAEVVKGKDIEEEAICTSCKKKKNIKQKRLYGIIFCLVLAFITVIILVATALT